MTLDAAHRSSIYEKLRPILGDEDANVLMSEFPAIEADELVTKDFLRAELVLTRAELREEMAGLGRELRGDMTNLAQELRGDMTNLAQELRGDMANLAQELRGEKANLAQELRSEISAFRLDMAALETRLTVRLGSAIAATAALLTAIGLLR